MMASTRHPRVLTVCLVAVAYGLLAKFSLALAIPPGNASAVWPAAGLAVAACLVYGQRIWPAILIGAMIANGTTSVSTIEAAFIGAGNSLEAVAVASLLTRFTGFGKRFPHSSDVFRFAAFAAAGALISSLIGPTTMLVAGHISPQDFLENWLTWWLGDTIGIIVTTPALMTWRSNAGIGKNPFRKAEIGLFTVVFGACIYFVFGVSNAPLLYLFLPLIVWLAFRFSQSEVSNAVFAFSAAVVWGLVVERGPMAQLRFNSALLLSLLSISVIGITGLALSAAIDERTRIIGKLHRIGRELESRINLRTTKLRQMIAALREDITARQQMQEELMMKEHQLESAQALAHLGSWSWDILRDRLMVSAEMARIYGIPPESLPLNLDRYLDYIPSEERSLTIRVVNDALLHGVPLRYEHRVIRPDGSVRYLDCRGTVETDAQGTPVKLHGTAHDLTEEKALERQLREAEEMYRKLVELSPDAIFLLDGERCTFSNEAGAKLLGADGPQQLIGQSFLEFISPSSRDIVGNGLAQLSGTERIPPVEGVIVRMDCSSVDVELSASAFMIGDKRSILAIVRDISERKKAAREIYHLAHHDALTGLANRILFKERMEHAIARAHRTSEPLVVLFIDLDRFKNVNDTAGHDAGDLVLRECANRLRECMRESDTIARAGGDEFLILIDTFEDPHHISAVAQKILATMSRPFQAAGKEFEIGASIGISLFPKDGTDAETLIKLADIAMYRVKMEGKNNFCYYSPSMTRHNLERYTMESALRHALDRGEMELYFQPKIDLADGRISGAEALMRWNHPEHGILLPYRFIPLAEEIGVVNDLGMWAIREACRKGSAWQKLGLPPVRIAVNLTYPQFSDDELFNHIRRLLEEVDLKPDALELEITETMVMENAENLMHSLEQVKEFGVHLSIDDFGTGYSSLAYLKRLPVDSVKVDRSFIRDLPNDSDDVAITHAILALVHSLKRRVVAEGVETREQLDFLIEHGCDAVQGFYFSPALPADDFCRLLARPQAFVM